MKYQYSYFIHPYLVDEDKYSKYLLRLLKNKKCKLKTFEKEKELNMYTYFLPKARKYLFSSFGQSKEKLEQLNKFDDNMKSVILSKETMAIFEYKIEEDMQAKIGEKYGIFFDITKIEIICFNTGICFLILKTILEGEPTIEDVLNFNYKFRDIASSMNNLKEYENIKIQTNSFKDIKTLEEIIKEITASNKDIKELNIDDERFLTYSYMCVEAEKWKDENDFENIRNSFIKFANILPSKYHVNFEKDRKDIEIIETLKNVKIGLSKQAVTLMTSQISPQNYTKLPYMYENEYLYTYILTVYQKIYLKKLELELTNTKSMKEIKKKFIEFTKSVYNQEITNDVEGNLLYEKLKKVLKINPLYSEIKSKYDLFFKEINIQTNYILIGAISAAIVIGIMNLLSLF